MERNGDVENIKGAGTEQRAVGGGELARLSEHRRKWQRKREERSGGEVGVEPFFRLSDVSAGRFAAEKAQLESVFHLKLLPRSED